MSEPLAPAAREQLDELKISTIAEYLCARLGLGNGEVLLQFTFKGGRYQRVARWLSARASE